MGPHGQTEHHVPLERLDQVSRAPAGKKRLAADASLEAAGSDNPFRRFVCVEPAASASSTPGAVQTALCTGIKAWNVHTHIMRLRSMMFCCNVHVPQCRLFRPPINLTIQVGLQMRMISQRAVRTP